MSKTIEYQAIDTRTNELSVVVPEHSLAYIFISKKLIGVVHPNNNQKVTLSNKKMDISLKHVEKIIVNYTKHIAINFGTPEPIQFNIFEQKHALKGHGTIAAYINKNTAFLSTIELFKLSDELYYVRLLQPFILEALQKILNNFDEPFNQEILNAHILENIVPTLNESLFKIGLTIDTFHFKKLEISLLR